MTRLEKMKIWAKLIWFDIRAYPKTTLFIGLILGRLAYLIFSWPSFMLLKYALGFTATLTSAELSALAIEYVSAFSFWGHLAAITMVSGLSIFYGIKRAVGFMNIIYCDYESTSLEKLFKALNDKHSNEGDDIAFNEQESKEFESQLDAVLRTVLGTPQRLSLAMSRLMNASDDSFYIDFVKDDDSREVFEKVLEDRVSLEHAHEAILELAKGFTKFLWLTITIEEILNSYLKNESLINYLVKRAEELYPAPSYVQERFERVIPSLAIEYFGLKDLRVHFLEQGTTPYALLDVPKNATLVQIHQAYRKKVLSCHPDKVTNTRETDKEFLLLTAAKNLLIDPILRANVDRELLKHHVAGDSVVTPEVSTGTTPDALTVMRNHHAVELPSDGSECRAIIPYRPFTFKI